MTTIYDLIEVTGIAENTTYSFAAGNLLGVIDGATGADLNDGEFDEGDSIVIGGVSYTIDTIQEPSSSGRFTLEDGSNRSFDPGSESNLSAIFLTVSNGSDVRYFIIPNDSYGDMVIDEIRTGSLTDVAGSDAAIISTTNNAIIALCFVTGAMIATASGPVAVQHIGRGDLVLTRDHGAQAVQDILTQEIDLTHAPENLKPIAFAAGALGPRQPNRRLSLSPQHRLLLTDHSGTPVLVPAKALLGRPGVRVMQGKRRIPISIWCFPGMRSSLPTAPLRNAFIPARSRAWHWPAVGLVPTPRPPAQPPPQSCASKTPDAGSLQFRAGNRPPPAPKDQREQTFPSG